MKPLKLPRPCDRLALFCQWSIWPGLVFFEVPSRNQMKTTSFARMLRQFRQCQTELGNQDEVHIIAHGHGGAMSNSEKNALSLRGRPECVAQAKPRDAVGIH